MASASRCLVDAALVVEWLRSGRLEEPCRGDGVAVGELALRDVHEWCARGDRAVVDVASLVAGGRIEVMRATVEEVAAVVRWWGRER